MDSIKANYKDIIVISLSCLFIFLLSTPHHEFVEFETRFVLFAREMLVNGISFFPTSYYQPYPDYPALSTILIYLCSLPFGTVNYLSAHLPFALAGSITILYLYFLLRRYNRNWALYTTCLMILTIAFYHGVRAMTLDLYTTLTSIAILYYFIRYEENSRTNIVLPVLGFLAFSFFTRGLIGYVIPCAVIFAYYCVHRRFTQLLTHGILLILYGALLTGILFGLAYLQGDVPFLKQVWDMQIAARIISLGHQTFYYYFTKLFLDYLVSIPAAILTILALRKEWLPFRKDHSNEVKLIQTAMLSALIIIIGMTIPHEKKARYILSIVPFACLIAGYIFVTPRRDLLVNIARYAIYAFCVGVFLMGFHLAILSIDKQYELHATSLLTIFFMTGIVFTLLNIFYKEHRTFLFLLLGVFSYVCIQIILIEPYLQLQNQTRPFVSVIESQLIDNKRLLFYNIGPDGNDIKFMVNMDNMAAPLFAQDEATLIASPGGTIVVTHAETFKPSDKLKKRIKPIAQGQIGHKTAVAFEILP